MPILMILAAASGLTVPNLGIDAARYLQEHTKDVKSGAATVEMVIGANGRLMKCAVLHQVGDAKLADRVCGLLAQLTFDPGTLGDGTKAAALIKPHIAAYQEDYSAADALQGLPKPSEDPDLVLTSAQLPGDEATADARVGVAVDTAGLVSQCVAASDGDPKAKGIAKAICANAATMKFMPLIDNANRPIPYVRWLQVHLAVDGAKVGN